MPKRKPAASRPKRAKRITAQRKLLFRSWLDPHPRPPKTGIELIAANRNNTVALEHELEAVDKRDYRAFLKHYREIDNPLRVGWLAGRIVRLLLAGAKLLNWLNPNLHCILQYRDVEATPFQWTGDTLENETLEDNPNY